jgi:protein TonB
MSAIPEAAASGAAGRPGEAPARRDPFEAVLGFGGRAVRQGLAAGFAAATLTHGACGGRALAAPVEMLRWAVEARQQIHEYLWSTYDVDVIKPEAAKPEPPKLPEEKPEQPEPSPAPKPAAPRPADDSPPPPAAQAGRVLTAPSDPNDPLDFTGNGFVQGNADSYVGGVTAPAGTGTVATYNPRASASGVPGGTGSAAAPLAARPQGPDLSRPPTVLSGASWSSCPFPPEADIDQVDYAVATIVVTVRPDGSALSVRVLSDPGHGFGRAARLCALSQRYQPAVDRDGQPAVGTTPPIKVTFTR